MFLVRNFSFYLNLEISNGCLSNYMVLINYINVLNKMIK